MVPLRRICVSSLVYAVAVDSSISSLKPLLTKSLAAKYADQGELNVSIAYFIKQYH